MKTTIFSKALKTAALLFTLLATVFVSPSALALKMEEEGNYSISIVKYQLSQAQVTETKLPASPTGAAIDQNEARDYSGHQLKVMSGVHYQIDKVVPANNSAAPFEVAPDNHSQTVVTDTNGQASISLSSGIYRVAEVAGNGIITAAAPIVVQLPLTLQNGQTVNHVYIYPKSGQVEKTKREEMPKKIPETAGNIQSAVIIYVLLIGVVLTGIYGIFIRPRKIK